MSEGLKNTNQQNQNSGHDAPLRQAITWVVAQKRKTCPVALAHVQRRLYRSVNAVWFELLQGEKWSLEKTGDLFRKWQRKKDDIRIPSTPLVCRRTHRFTPSPSLAPTRVFTEEEVITLQSQADQSRHSYDGLFICILFRTGLRIGAIHALRWVDVLHPKENRICDTTVVLEKGGFPRAILIDDELKRRLWVMHNARKHDQHVAAKIFPRGVRTLRNHFYTLCQNAGLTGPHCHPHIARHTVAHLLFAAGNPISLVAKFLGHRSISTTNTYYLRLEFHEVMAQIKLPTLFQKT